MKTNEGVLVTVTTFALSASLVGSYCPWPNPSLPCYIHSFGVEAPELPQTHSPIGLLNSTIVMSGTANASLPSPSFEIPSLA